MFKKILVYAVIINVLLGSCATTKSELTLSLDSAIQESAIQISNSLNSGTIIAIVNITSESIRVSEYVLEELSLYLPKNKNISVVDRRNLDLIRQEMNYQLSGEVSDESARAIGKQLGANVIITGSLTRITGNYRLRLRAINVETAVIESTSSFTVRNNDRTLAELNKEAGNQLTTTARRYVTEDGLFTIEKPETWKLRDIPLMRYKGIYAMDEFGITIFISFAAEEYKGSLSLSEYTSLASETLRYFSEDVDVITPPRQFITRSGLKGMRMELSYSVNEVYFYQVMYTFDGKDSLKVAVNCAIMVNFNEFSEEAMEIAEIYEIWNAFDDGDFEKWNNIFNEIVWTFSLL